MKCVHHKSALALALFIAVVSVAALPAVQGTAAKKALIADDYTRWRSINGAEISGDGKWVTYVLQQTNTAQADAKPVLHLLNLDTNADVAIPNATGGQFSADSQWIAYLVEPPRPRGGRSGAATDTPTPSADTQPPPTTPPAPTTPPGEGGRGGAAAQTPPRRAELRNLATGAVRSWESIQSFTFSPQSTHLVLRRRPPTPAGAAAGRGGAPTAPPGDAPGGAPAAGGAAGATPTGPRGADVVLLDLASGRHQLLGSVGDIAFNKKGDLLAYTVDGTVKDGNGLFVFDARNGRITPLDNDAKVYNRLAWSEDGTAVAVLKGVDVEKMRERDNVLIAFSNVQSALDASSAKPALLDGSKVTGLPRGWVISDRAPLAWSEDNKRVFFGMKEQVEAPPSNARSNRDEQPDVDVWSTSDERVQSQQMIRADQDRNFTFRQAFDVAGDKFVKLADETMRDLDLSKDGRWAVGRDTRGYIHDYKRPAADLYRVNTTTGERTLIAKGQLAGSHVLGLSTDSRQLLYWKDSRFHAYDLEAGTNKMLGNGTAVSFVDTEFDRPGPRPSFGIAGYTSDGKGVIAHTRYDLWLVPFDGSAPQNLTNGTGTKNEIRFRHVRLENEDSPAPGGDAARPGGGGPNAAREPIDLSKPQLLSAYGEYTKKAGFYELANGELKELVYEDAAFNTPVKAKKADKLLFTRSTFVEFADLRVSGLNFKDAKKITDANPQQSEYLWGKRILFDYKNKDGKRLQGILAIPDDYKQGEKRPMIVTFYEKNSQNMHRYNAPSYLTGMGGSAMEAVTRGYLTMLPDIHFRTGSSHSDMLECVEAAVRKVIEMGYVDPKRIGINGHSYGGEGAAFIGTQSKLFSAVAMGAGVTDLYNDFNQNWGWAYQVSGGSGANGFDYYLYGQGRWGFSPWDDPERYRFESALTHAPKVQVPFLIMHGTADPTVAFQNGLGFYNALRYNGKTAYLLAYPGEGHGLRGMANRKDLTIRYFEFFDHYLKGAPAPKWMTDGVPFLKKDMKPPPTRPTTTTTTTSGQ